VWPLGLPCIWLRFSADLPFASCLLQCTCSLSQDSCNQRTNTIEQGSWKAYSSLVKNFPVYYGIRGLVTFFTIARPSSLSRAGGIQSMSYHAIFIIHFNTVLPSQPRSYEWFLPSPFPIKILCASLLSPIRATWTVHLVLDLITRGVKTWTSSLFHFLRPLITSPLLHFSNYSVDLQIQSPTSTAVFHHSSLNSYH
jgi:hypothetical protein